MSKELDPLTGYTNRKHMEFDFLELTCTPTILQLIVIDVDGMKCINDIIGHIAGDRLLAQVASIMKITAGKHYDSYRIGGDEFAFLFAHTTTPKVKQIAVDMQDKVRARIPDIPLILGDALPLDKVAMGFSFSISFGVATYPRDGRDLTTLLECAWKRLDNNRRNDGWGAIPIT
jgi:diguanylate cyclase (GGDEF)-like protein